jgi:hypothetical protein
MRRFPSDLVVIARRAASWKMMRGIMTCDEIAFEVGATSAQGYKKILLFDSLDRTRCECNWSLIERLFALSDAHSDAISGALGGFGLKLHCRLRDRQKGRQINQCN